MNSLFSSRLVIQYKVSKSSSVVVCQPSCPCIGSITRLVTPGDTQPLQVLLLLVVILECTRGWPGLNKGTVVGSPSGNGMGL